MYTKYCPYRISQNEFPYQKRLCGLTIKCHLRKCVVESFGFRYGVCHRHRINTIFSRRWVFDSSGDLLVEESRGSVWTTSLRLQQWRGGKDGQTQAGHSPSLSYIQTARTRIVSPLAHISLAAGWKKQEQQSQQTVSWTVPLFPLKATFPTLLSSLPSRWCSACEKPVGFQMTRCKSVTRSRI